MRLAANICDGALHRALGVDASRVGSCHTRRFRRAGGGMRYYGYRHLSTVSGRWLTRDPIGERAERTRRRTRSPDVTNMKKAITAFPVDPGVMRDFEDQARAGTLLDIHLRFDGNQGALSSRTEDVEDRHLNCFVLNNAISRVDPLGLAGRDYTDLINAARAIWLAAQTQVPGSEFCAALEALGGCRTLGTINAWAQVRYARCISDNGVEDQECVEIDMTVRWLTSIWSRLCQEQDE